jgi:hypothetical protein
MPTPGTTSSPTCPPTSAAAAPGHARAGRARRPRSAVPDGPHRAGGHDGALHRHPRRGAWTSTACGARRPLFRARRLEKALGTPARIYYKYEGTPRRLAQAEHRGAAGLLQREGRHPKLTTETGAGQWGTAFAFACADVRHRVRDLAGPRLLRPEAVPPGDDGGVRRDGAPVAVGPHRVRGASCSRTDPDPPARSASPSPRPSRSRRRTRTRYALGSVLNHVLLHQTIIGEEALLQLAKAGDTPTSSSAAPAAARTSAGSPSRSSARSWPAT